MHKCEIQGFYHKCIRGVNDINAEKWDQIWLPIMNTWDSIQIISVHMHSAYKQMCVKSEVSHNDIDAEK